MSHGARWEAIGADLDTVVEDYIAPLCENARFVAEAPVESDWPHGRSTELVAALAHPDGPISLMALVATRDRRQDQRDLLAAFPWCAAGVTYPVKIVEAVEWEGPAQGIVQAELGPSYVEFFDPFWFLNRDLYEPGKELEVSLSALAYGLTPVHPDAHVLIDDPEQIRRMLPPEDTEGKADAELEAVEVRYAGARAYIPRGDADAEFMSVIDEIAEARLLHIPVEVLTVGLFVDTSVAEELVFRVPLYVAPAARPEHFTPTVGESIQGVLWLQGTLVRS